MLIKSTSTFAPHRPRLRLRSVEPYPPNERPRPSKLTTSGGQRAPRVQYAILETVREITPSS